MNKSDNTLFKYPIVIKEHHLDTFGHVNNAIYLQLLEEARWELLHTQGINLQSIQESKIGPIILECRIQFLKELTLRQSIVIESQLHSFDKKVGIMHQNIMNEHGDLCSHATITFGVFDMTTRKMIIPPKQWLLALGVASPN